MSLDFETGAPRLQAEMLGAISAQRTLPNMGVYSSSGGGAARNVELRIRDLYRETLGVHIPQTSRIVVGVGSTHLIAAAFWAAREVLGAAPLLVRNYFGVPYYTLHRRIADTLKEVEFSTTQFAEFDGGAGVHVINAVSPSNPDSRLISESQARAVWGPEGAPYMMLDTVYDFPGFTGQPTPQNAWAYTFDADNAGLIRLASHSKFGMAGARLGWMITEDAAIADVAQTYVNTSMLGYSLFAGSACDTVLRYARQPSWHARLYNTLQTRHEDIRFELQRIFPGQDRVLSSGRMAPFVYTSVPIAWWLENVDTEMRAGTGFADADPSNARVMLMGTSAEWRTFMERLRAVLPQA